MASIHLTENGTWAVHYATGKRQHKKTFKNRTDAKRFLAYITLSPEKRQSKITAAAILAQYRDEESVKKRGYRTEALRINRFIKAPWASKPVAQITTREVQEWIDSRVLDKGLRAGATLGDGTILREGANLKAVFSWASRIGLCAENPFKAVKLPREPEHRERTASADDIEALKVSAGWNGTDPVENEIQLVLCAFLFACQTGMRSGEIVKLEETWIEGRVIHIPKSATKTDSHRDVALSKEAMRLLDLARAFTKEAQIFGGGVTDKVRDALWRKMRDRAGLGAVVDSQGRVVREGLNFHDSRATFCTWAASPDQKTGSPRLELLALARQTGHKNLKNLQRYYRASAESLASRLD